MSRRARGTFALSLALLGLGASGCGGTSDPVKSGETNAPRGVAAAPFVRRCDPHVGWDRIGATRADVVLGSARLYSVGQHASIRNAAVFERGSELDGDWRAFKTLVILDGPEATLRVPRYERSDFLLSYDPSVTSEFAYSFSDGQAAVRFVNCEPPLRALEFPGALIAKRSGCYHLEGVARDGSAIAKETVNIAAGRGAC